MSAVDFSQLKELNNIIDYTLNGTFIPGGGINSIAQSCLDYIANKYNIDIKQQVRINVMEYWKNILDNVGIESITVQEIGDKTLSFLGLEDIFKKGLINEDLTKKEFSYTPGNNGYNLLITDKKGITSNINNPESPPIPTTSNNGGNNTPIIPPIFSEPVKNEPIKTEPVKTIEEKPVRTVNDNTDITNLINSRTTDLDNKIDIISDNITKLNDSVTKKIEDISTTVDKTLDTVIKDITDTVKNIVDSIDDKISGIGDSISNIIGGIVGNITDSYDSVIKYLTDTITSIYDNISDEIKQVLSVITGIATAIYDFIASLLEILKSAIDYLFEKLTKFMDISEEDILIAMKATMEFVKKNIINKDFVSSLNIGK